MRGFGSSGIQAPGIRIWSSDYGLLMVWVQGLGPFRVYGFKHDAAMRAIGFSRAWHYSDGREHHRSGSTSIHSRGRPGCCFRSFGFGLQFAISL